MITDELIVSVSTQQRENKQLMHANIRLEQENDELARELIVHRLAMEKQLDKVTDRQTELNAACEYLKSS